MKAKYKYEVDVEVDFPTTDTTKSSIAIKGLIEVSLLGAYTFVSGAKIIAVTAKHIPPRGILNLGEPQ